MEVGGGEEEEGEKCDMEKSGRREQGRKTVASGRDSDENAEMRGGDKRGEKKEGRRRKVDADSGVREEERQRGIGER